MTKTCTKCGKEKPLDGFKSFKSGVHGRRSQCRACENAMRRARYAAHPYKRLAKNREWVAEHKDAVNKYKYAWKAANKDHVNSQARKRYIDRGPDANLKRRLRSNYGLSVDEYNAMFVAQNGRCAICGGPETHVFKGAVVRLSVDHSHETGRIRQLLCRHCNTLLGFAGDDQERLLAAAMYLERHSQ